MSVGICSGASSKRTKKCLTKQMISDSLFPTIEIVARQLYYRPDTHSGFYQPGMLQCIRLVLQLYFVIFCMSVCMSVGASVTVQGDLGTSQWWTAGTSAGWFVCLFAANGNQAMLLLFDSRGTALVTQAQCCRGVPEAQECQDTGSQLRTSRDEAEIQIAMVLQYSVSHKQVPSTSRLAVSLESISQPVHRPITCMMTRTYLVPACTTRAGFLDVLMSDLLEHKLQFLSMLRSYKSKEFLNLTAAKKVLAFTHVCIIIAT